MGIEQIPWAVSWALSRYPELCCGLRADILSCVIGFEQIPWAVSWALSRHPELCHGLWADTLSCVMGLEQSLWGGLNAGSSMLWGVPVGGANNALRCHNGSSNLSVSLFCQGCISVIKPAGETDSGDEWVEGGRDEWFISVEMQKEQWLILCYFYFQRVPLR